MRMQNVAQDLGALGPLLLRCLAVPGGARGAQDEVVLSCEDEDRVIVGARVE